MLLPAITGVGVSAFVIDKAAELPTCTLAVVVLFVAVGSAGVVSVTVAVSEIVVPWATPVFTVTTNEKLAVVFAAKVVAVLFVHFSVASVQVHPAGPVSETAVVLAGRVSVRVIEPAVAKPAVAGPRFFTTCV